MITRGVIDKVTHYVWYVGPYWRTLCVMRVYTVKLAYNDQVVDCMACLAEAAKNDKGLDDA